MRFHAHLCALAEYKPVVLIIAATGSKLVSRSTLNLTAGTGIQVPKRTRFRCLSPF